MFGGKPMSKHKGLLVGDIPQVRELHEVRAVVSEIDSNVTDNGTISSHTAIAPRQIKYAIAGARTLGFVERVGKIERITERGKQLLASKPRSAEETELLRQAIIASPAIGKIAPELLSVAPPTKSAIVAAIVSLSGLSEATAEHRAGALLAWRRQLGDPQLSLDNALPRPGAPRMQSPATPAQAQSPVIPASTRPKVSNTTLSEEFVGEEPEIERIRKKVSSNQYHQLLRSVMIDGLRGFRNCKIELPFPIVALVGENGAGKTTALKAMACAYDQGRAKVKAFSPGLFFMATQWDKVTGVTLTYSIKHGTEDRPVTLRKPTVRWRGIEERPKRHVYFLDISRTMPIDALVGYAQIAKNSSKFGSEDLEVTLRSRLSWLMGRTYKAAKFAVSLDKRVGVLTQEFGEYSKFHQGAGESSSLDLMGILQNVADNSLVLIDEVEASLHPKAQRRLIKTLLGLCRKKTLQLVITTHSRYILEELPAEARILLLKGRDIQIVYGASPEYCLSSIDEKIHPELAIFVEDRSAAVLLREILARWDRENNTHLISRTDIVPVGPANVVTTLDTLGQQRTLRYPCLGIVDADCQDAGTALRLPGRITAPERGVFADLTELSWPMVAERFGIPAGDIIAHLEDAALMPNHHDWCTTVGSKIKMSKYRVWENLASLWVAHVMQPTILREFIERIQDRMQ
jgi:predicted ATPase